MCNLTYRRFWQVSFKVLVFNFVISAVLDSRARRDFVFAGILPLCALSSVVHVKDSPVRVNPHLPAVWESSILSRVMPSSRLSAVVYEEGTPAARVTHLKTRR